LATTIQDLINSAAPGATVTVPTGTYDVSGLSLENVTLKAGGDVTLKGNMTAGSNTVLSGFTFSGGTVDISNSNGVKIQNSVFNGGEHSVKFDAARDASIVNNSFHNVSNTVLDGWGLDQSTISNNQFYDCYQPINLAFNNVHDQGRDITVSDNYFTGTGRMPIEVGPIGAYTSNLVVDGNWSENMNNVGQQDGWSTDVAYSVVPTYGVNTHITNNYAEGIGSGVGIELNGSGEISGNYVDNFWYGTIVYGSDFNVHDNALVNSSVETVLNYSGTPGTVQNNQTSAAGFSMPTKPGKADPAPVADQPAQSETASHSDPASDTNTGTGHPVYAADDHYSLDAGKSLWFNTRYLTWNDKGVDGDLKIASIDAVSEHGVKVSVNPDGFAHGTTVYKAPADFHGTDHIKYTVKDHDGSVAVAHVVIDVA